MPLTRPLDDCSVLTQSEVRERDSSSSVLSQGSFSSSGASGVPCQLGDYLL